MRSLSRPGASSTVILLIGILLFVIGNYSYVTLRFLGNWAENDTLLLTRVIYAASEEGTIIDQAGPYGNGLTYQGVMLFIMEISGVSLQQLQIYVMPITNFLLAVMAFTTYRLMIGQATAALVATLLLFVQPDFLFVTWRGSHERITWMLGLFLLFLLARRLTQRPDEPAATFAGNTISLYVTIFAFICCNAFFASSFVVTLALAYLGGFSIVRLRALLHRQDSLDLRANVTRLYYLIVAFGILLFLFFFYIYPPALHLLRALRSLVDGVVLLFLHGNQEIANNPYDYVATTWLDSRIYVLMLALSFGIALVATLVWIIGIPRLLLRKAPLTRDDLPRVFLWLIYPSYVLQIVLSLMVDWANGLGSNIQVRLFPPLMIVAIPLVAIGITEGLRRLRWRALRSLVVIVVTLTVIPACIFALFKATNEPALSNNWLFGTHSEVEASQWVIDRGAFEGVVWAGSDRRIPTVMQFRYPDEWIIYPEGNFDYGEFAPHNTRYYIVTALDTARRLRQGLPLLDLSGEHQVYDNGSVQVFYRRPRTPFQY